MTGIERLRALSAGWDEMGLGGVLADVAEQIERELSDERRRRSRDWREVSQVQREMRQLLFGHDSAGDDLLSRWAERLLAAICSSAAGDDASMSAYDALPPETCEAIAWVRKHGGIVNVEEAWERRKNLARRLETAQAKVERQQRHIEFIQRKCRARQARIVELNKAVAEMRPRLMPKGIEWPRFEDGEPVEFGDEVAIDDGDGASVSKIVFCGDLWRLYDRYGCEINEDMMGPGERVKRPAPEDSWERLEEDVANASCPDVYCANHHIDASDTSYEWAMARDIVRRARALAERDA